MRKMPYTENGIRRLKCIRCGAQAKYQWQICADANQYRPFCEDCDIALNEMVLKWMGVPDWQEKMAAYRKSLGVEP